jgi:hypothetical protein
MVRKTVGELSPFKDIESNEAMLKRLQEHGYVRYNDLPLETMNNRHVAVEFVSRRLSSWRQVRPIASSDNNPTVRADRKRPSRDPHQLKYRRFLSNTLERNLKFRHLHGLAQVIIHSGCETLFAVALHGVSSQGDDINRLRPRTRTRQTLLRFADRSSCVLPVHFRHLTVHQDEVIWRTRQRLQHLQTISHGVRLVTQFLQAS